MSRSYVVKHEVPEGTVVITGDLHCSWVADLKVDLSDENSDTVGTEFIGTSISASLSEWYIDAYKWHRDQNPHVKYFDERTGAMCAASLPPTSGARI